MTISHYETPFGLTQKYNGWASREVIEFYIRYCTTLFNRYKDQVKYWLTFNEINCLTMPLGAYMAGGLLFEGKETLTDGVDQPQTRFQALHHQFVASAKAVKLGHEINPDFKIGCMVAFMTTYPNTCNPDDILLAQKKDQLSNMICGDVQVRGAYPGFAKRFFAEEGIEIQMQPEDEQTLREGCVDFYPSVITCLSWKVRMHRWIVRKEICWVVSKSISRSLRLGLADRSERTALYAKSPV